MPRRIIFSMFIFFNIATPAYGWGERGHDLVARVAARLLIARHGTNQALTGPLAQKEHMLGHLANVPDIVWRNGTKEVADANGPTHYLDLEYLGSGLAFGDLPLTIGDMEQRLGRLCAEKPKGYACPAKDGEKPVATMAGTAPFRVKQLAGQMQAAFARAAGVAKSGGKELAAAVNEALLAGGVLAHFIGDLAQPLHATVDYDGYGIGQGGSHGYFESDVVSAYDLTLDHEVMTAATALKPLGRLGERFPKERRGELERDPLALAWALTLDSFERVAELHALDKKLAVTRASSTEKGMKIKAERRPAAEVAPNFRPLVVERLALGAETLAVVWQLAWEQAGRPDLSAYQSWDYPTTPAFIPVNY